MVSLEEIFGRENLEGVRGREISIDPEQKKYQRKYFVEHAGDYFDLEGYYATLRQNNGDIDSMNDISNLLIPQNPNLLLKRGSEGILLAADAQLSLSSIDLAKYTKNRDLADKLSGEQLQNVIINQAHPDNLLIYTANEKEHDRLAEIIKKRAAILFQKPEVLKKDIPELMKNAPIWHQILYSRYSEDQTYLSELINSYASVISKVYEKEFTKKRGDKRVPDKAKLHKFYDRNLKIVTDEVDKEPDQKTKEKIWDKSAKPVYLLTAKTLYESEKEKEKKETQTGEEKRKEERKKLGMYE